MLMLILIIALLLVVAGIILLIKPDFILGFMEKYSGSWGMYAGAIIARLGLGYLFIDLASLSRFPRTVTVIGWIAIIAAVSFILMGKQNFTILVKRIINKIGPWGRAGGAASLLFGAFLLYAFV